MNLLLPRSSRLCGTPTMGALVVLIGLAVGCGADTAVEIDASSREDADVDAATMPPDLEVAWIPLLDRC